MQGCEAYWSRTYEATTPVIEILKEFCDHFGLLSRACRLYMGQNEVPKDKLLGQVLLPTILVKLADGNLRHVILFSVLAKCREHTNLTKPVVCTLPLSPLVAPDTA